MRTEALVAPELVTRIAMVGCGLLVFMSAIAVVLGTVGVASDEMGDSIEKWIKSQGKGK